MLTPEHALIKHRRNGSTIYRCPHNTHYLKVGSSSQILYEVTLYQDIKKLGFPLPDLISYEINEDSLSWMKEGIVSGNLYSDIFTSDCKKEGKISELQCNNFIHYQQNHLTCQLSINHQQISSGTFDRIWNALEKEKIIDSAMIFQVKTKIHSILEKFPVVWNHGDHNPYNIFSSGGIIDLEDSFVGPLGYDTITSITQNYWFDATHGELIQEHWFSSTQIQQYLQQCSLDLMDFTDINVFSALMLMRGVFVTVGSSQFPILQHTRYNKLITLMNLFLDTGDCYDHFIEYYRTIS